MAQLVERVLGKDEVPSSNLGSSSTYKKAPLLRCFFASLSVKRFELLIFACKNELFAVNGYFGLNGFLPQTSVRESG